MTVGEARQIVIMDDILIMTRPADTIRVCKVKEVWLDFTGVGYFICGTELESDVTVCKNDTYM